MTTTVVLRQDALNVVSADRAMAREVDGEWIDDHSETVGDRLRALNDLCVEVLERHGYKIPATKDRTGAYDQ